VIKGADEIRVVLSDRRELEAKLIGSDERTDLAVLRIDAPPDGLPTLELGDSDGIEVGDLVLAIGNPFGVGQTVTSGIVSATARTMVGVSDYRFFIQTDAAINPGNSGGALLAMDGRLIGINTAIYTRGGGSQGVGFAVPANVARIIVESGVEGRPLVHPWIGVTGVRAPPRLALFLGLPRPTGVVVTGVYEGGPAADAGIRPGDVILSIGGIETDSLATLRYRVATRRLGETARLVVLRMGVRIEVDVTLVAPPDQPIKDETLLSGLHPLSGARVASLSPAFAEQLGLDSAIPGIVVLEVRTGSAAAGLGLRAGDIVRAFEGRELRTVAELRAIALTPFKPRRLLVNRGGEEIIIGG